MRVPSNGPQLLDAETVPAVDTPGNTSNEEEDGASAGFDDLSGSSYTNGISTPTNSMSVTVTCLTLAYDSVVCFLHRTYFSTENTYPATSYYNYNSQVGINVLSRKWVINGCTVRNQTVNQIIADGGAYLVMESDPGSGTSSSQRTSPQTVST